MNKFLSKIEEFLDIGGEVKDVIFLAISSVALVLSIFEVFPYAPFNPAWVAIILCGTPIVIKAIIGLILRFDIKADVLVSIALLGSLSIHEWFAAGQVAFIMQLGGLLEQVVSERAKDGINKLISMNPKVARVVTETGFEMTSVEEVKFGSTIRVLIGEMIPLDGVISKGDSCVDEAIITGESIPPVKHVGDYVMSGSINLEDVIEIEVTKTWDESSIQKVIQLVKDTNVEDNNVIRLTDKWASYVVLIAFTCAIVTYFVTGVKARAITALVVFCPCSLVLAAPVAVIAVIGNLAKYGCLVHKSDALEQLSYVNKIFFDKTGTLTTGKLSVIYNDITDAKVLSVVKAAEDKLNHPVSIALVEYIQNSVVDVVLSQFEYAVGCGITTSCDGVTYYIGNSDFIRTRSTVEVPQYKSVGTTVYVVTNSFYYGCFRLMDSVRQEVPEAINDIKKLGLKFKLLTGDNKETADLVASSLGIEDVVAECLPEDKIKQISEAQQTEKVVMLGDGINDLPAMKKADVSIAMGLAGADITSETADIVFTTDNIKVLPHLLKITKRMLCTIKLNIVFSMVLNFLSIGLAAFGLLNPISGALTHNIGSVAVVLNSALLLNWKGR